MRFMILVKANKDSEAGQMPDEGLIAAMADYHEQLVKAGALLDASGLAKAQIDGLAVSSFSLGSDTTIALTEHFDMSPRWIEWLPTGGASGVMALRRAARAVQDGDASVVACIAGDTANPQAFGDLVRNFSRFSPAVYPYGAAGPNRAFASTN